MPDNHFTTLKFPGYYPPENPSFLIPTITIHLGLEDFQTYSFLYVNDDKTICRVVIDNDSEADLQLLERRYADFLLSLKSRQLQGLLFRGLDEKGNINYELFSRLKQMLCIYADGNTSEPVKSLILRNCKDHQQIFSDWRFPGLIRREHNSRKHKSSLIANGLILTLCVLTFIAGIVLTSMPGFSFIGIPMLISGAIAGALFASELSSLNTKNKIIDEDIAYNIKDYLPGEIYDLSNRILFRQCIDNTQLLNTLPTQTAPQLVTEDSDYSSDETPAPESTFSAIL